MKIRLGNGKCKTLWEGETSVFLCEPETFLLLQLQDWDFKVFDTQAWDSQVLRHSDIIYEEKANKPISLWHS